MAEIIRHEFSYELLIWLVDISEPLRLVFQTNEHANQTTNAIIAAASAVGDITFAAWSDDYRQSVSFYPPNLRAMQIKRFVADVG